ncbi:MAG: pyruvoyl-dependent arginine decarboxylase, partial [Promethearchaeota archaeon]
KGKGFSDHSELRSFEEALRDAGIEKFNIVKVSSIIPPNCLEVNRDKGLRELKIGQIIFSVMSKNSSNKRNDEICASIGMAKPRDEEHYGYLSEKHSINEDPKNIAKLTQELAVEMLTTTLGISYELNTKLNEEKEILEIEGKPIKTKSITESTTVNKNGEWATVIAAAIFII